MATMDIKIAPSILSADFCNLERDLERISNADTNIQVDGGVSPKTAATVAQAGANILVAGSAVYGAADPAKAINEIRDTAAAAYRD